jgi:hypothetical protein
MILLDNNVISEPWKPAPDNAVVAWLEAQTIETLFLSTITSPSFVSGSLPCPRETLAASTSLSPRLDFDHRKCFLKLLRLKRASMTVTFWGPFFGLPVIPSWLIIVPHRRR